MAAQTFAAIVIGSAMTEMRIYELSQRRGMKQIDCISSRLSLGTEAYRQGRLAEDKIHELCRILKDFKSIMEGYHVSGYTACATSAFREIRSAELTRDYIEKQTGLTFRVISNSEQRFLDYKSLAGESRFFTNVIRTGTAIVDVGGSSMQISVFDKDKLVTTQNIRMGSISTMERFRPSARNTRHYADMMKELMAHELHGFGRLYQKDRQIGSLIVIAPDLYQLALGRPEIRSRTSEADTWISSSREMFESLYEKALNLSSDEIASQFALTADAAQVCLQSMIYCHCLLQTFGAETLYLADVSICDGLCYDYGVRHKLIRQTHDFEEDIIAASRNISKRYKCSQSHIRNMEYLSLEIFDKMKKIHGMGRRERLLLQISAILHNCGKYISLVNVSDCAYNIIMATEIIGLSHAERRIIANVVRFNTSAFTYYEAMSAEEDISKEDYLIIAKLTAILRVANALDRTHEQKCQEAQITLKDRELLIHVRTAADLTVEKVSLAERDDFFVEVFNVHPVLRQKKKER